MSGVHVIGGISILGAYDQSQPLPTWEITLTRPPPQPLLTPHGYEKPRSR